MANWWHWNLETIRPAATWKAARCLGRKESSGQFVPLKEVAAGEGGTVSGSGQDNCLIESAVESSSVRLMLLAL